MAKSPAHRFGQIIGDALEAAVEPLLRDFAAEHDLFLDVKGKRPARSGKKVAWKDKYGNTHDLDFVMERHGTPTKIGIPVAFIESAWRRYTKHSRNKAQEVQGAILPLAETHAHVKPFTGAVLAGVFTQGAITQLESLGFAVMYFSYDRVKEAFAVVGIDAHFEEDTPEPEFSRKVNLWDALSDKDKGLVYDALIELNSNEVEEFMDDLRRNVERRIDRIVIIPLHGERAELSSIEEAKEFLVGYADKTPKGQVLVYQVAVVYGNKDRIDGEFQSKDAAIRFLDLCQMNAA